MIGSDLDCGFDLVLISVDGDLVWLRVCSSSCSLDTNVAIYLPKALTTLPSYLPIYLAKTLTTLPILHNVHSKALTKLANIHQCIKIE